MRTIADPDPAPVDATVDAAAGGPASGGPASGGPASGGPASGVAVVHSHRAALALLALLSLVWGAHWVVVKIGLGYLPPLTYSALRVATGLGALVVLLAAQGRVRRPARESWPIVLSVGLGQIAANTVLMSLALQVVPAGRSSVLAYTMPIWVAVMLALAFRVRPRRNEVLGLVLGVGGLAFLLNPAVIDWGSGGELLGAAGLLLNAAIWAAVTIHVRRHRWTQTPLELQPWQLLVAAVPLVVAAILVDGGRGIRWEPATLLILLYSGPLATAFAFWATQSITRSLGAQASGIGFLAVPVVGLASGALVLGESLGPVDLLGFALVLGGIGVTSLVRSGEPATAAVEPGTVAVSPASVLEPEAPRRTG